MPITYVCNKCKKIVFVKSDKEFGKEVEIHSKICDGKFELPDGDCIYTALFNLIKFPKWLFCYSFIETENGKYVHAWNEALGEIEFTEGRKMIKIGEKGKEYFSIDYSNKKTVASSREDFYEKMNIKDVKRFSFEEVMKNILDCVKKEKDIFYWID